MSAADFVPDHAGLEQLTDAARGCRGCELYESATQTVFGAGPPDARVVLVGEQPGDVEDRRGAPFVGPAGRLLDRALGDAGIDRRQAYVTNAVKHFRFTTGRSTGGRGPRRLHATPDRAHIVACQPWLAAELAVLAPEVVVALGATAGSALVGPAFRVTKQRGQLLAFEPPSGMEDAGVHAAWLLATVHPSSVLRVPDEDRDAAYAALVADLTVAAKALAG